MRKQLENAMYEEVQNELNEIASMELGSDAYVRTTNCVNAMIDRVHESKKLENEALRLEIENKKLDVEMDKNRDEKKNNIAKNIMSGVTFTLSMAAFIWSNIDSKKFEMGYTHTTEPGRASGRRLMNLLDKFIK